MGLSIIIEMTFNVFPLRINPITGRWEEPKGNPMEEMSEEQKEYEAMRLVHDLDKLQRYLHVFVHMFAVSFLIANKVSIYGKK